MTTRKIYALCKKLDLGTTYYQNIGFGFFDEVEAEPFELENRLISVFRDKQLVWYEKELARIVKKDGLHLCTDLFLGDGLLVCDGGTKDNPWKDVTCYIRINPLDELWVMYQQEIAKGPKMPDLKQFERHCKQLARRHWKNKDSFPKEYLRAAG